MHIKEHKSKVVQSLTTATVVVALAAFAPTLVLGQDGGGGSDGGGSSGGSSGTQGGSNSGSKNDSESGNQSGTGPGSQGGENSGSQNGDATDTGGRDGTKTGRGNDVNGGENVQNDPRNEQNNKNGQLRTRESQNRNQNRKNTLEGAANQQLDDSLSRSRFENELALSPDEIQNMSESEQGSVDLQRNFFTASEALNSGDLNAAASSLDRIAESLNDPEGARETRRNRNSEIPGGRQTLTQRPQDEELSGTPSQGTESSHTNEARDAQRGNTGTTSEEYTDRDGRAPGKEPREQSGEGQARSSQEGATRNAPAGQNTTTPDSPSRATNETEDSVPQNPRSTGIVAPTRLNRGLTQNQIDELEEEDDESASPTQNQENNRNNQASETPRTDGSDPENRQILAREARSISEYAEGLRSGKITGNKGLAEISARAQAAMAQYHLKKAAGEEMSMQQGQDIVAAVGYARQALKNIGLYPPQSEEKMAAFSDVAAQAKMMANGAPMNNIQKSDLLASANTLIDNATVSVSNYDPTVPQETGSAPGRQ